LLFTTKLARRPKPFEHRTVPETPAETRLVDSRDNYTVVSLILTHTQTAE